MTNEKAYEVAEQYLNAIFCSKDDCDSFFFHIAIQDAIKEKDSAWLTKQLGAARDMCDELIEALSDGR